jgi:uncharacterized membrane protein YbhN (UPF0104 family)
MRAGLKKFSALIPIVMLPLGLWLGYQTFREHSFAEVWASISEAPTSNLLLAAAAAASSYFCLTFFDFLGVRYAGNSIAYPKVAIASFVSLSIGHTVGVAILSSGALRYRFYARLGLSAAEVAKIILFSATTVALGLGTLGAIALVTRPGFVESAGITPIVARSVGILCVAFVLIYVLLAMSLRRPLRIRNVEFKLPDVRMAAAQVALGTLNFALVAATLHQLLAAAAPYSEVLGAYVLGNIAGLLSHVPGGLGVLEFVIQSAVQSAVANGDVLAALIAFRIVYYVVPLILGCLLLIGAELGDGGRVRSE